MKNVLPREFYVPKGAMKITDKQSSAVAYVQTYDSGRVHALGLFGKAQKPNFHYTFKSVERAERHVRQFFQNCREHQANRAQRKEQRTIFAHAAKVGDVYKTCWGYDQTNVEFFEIVEIKGKYAILREIAAESISNGSGQDRLMPMSGAFLEPRYKDDDRGLPIRRLIQDGYIKIDEVRHGRPWGTRVAGVLIGRPATATSSGWGH